jgi:hypothetical protein
VERLVWHLNQLGGPDSNCGSQERAIVGNGVGPQTGGDLLTAWAEKRRRFALTTAWEEYGQWREDAIASERSDKRWLGDRIPEFNGRQVYRRPFWFL